MSGAQVLDFGSGPDLGNLGFPDLEKNLELRLEAIKTLPDLEKLIKMVNPLLKAERFNEDEQGALRRLRQRAYDRKRHSKFPNSTSKSVPNLELQISKPAPDLGNQISKSADLELQISKPSVPNEMPKPAKSPQPERKEKMTAVTTLPHQKTESFSQGAERALASINGEQFVKTAPKMALWFCAAGIVSFFLWQQSLALYQSAGFVSPLYSAAGGILMIVGFAAFHSITRSWIALFFCFYALAYEGYLMVSGTFNDDKQIAAIAVQNDLELIFLQEKADKERTKYHELKQRYDDPESKVFKNDWFSKIHLTPAWEASVQAHEEFAVKRAALMSATNDIHITWLKIFYRLGLVFLCMMLVHRFFASCKPKVVCAPEKNRPFENRYV
jgi:hypothetical protein